MTEPAFTPRVFSGIQPSGGLTLGNYLGAMKRFVDMQDAAAIETIYCMVDLHAITVWQDPDDAAPQHPRAVRGLHRLRDRPGTLDPLQPEPGARTRAAGWIFNCVARMGWMGRMTQWKDKAGKNAENASLGLFAYPALMAADILVYHATHVPVGEDQKQHLELTRDIAAKFNHDYGVDFFPLTEPVIEGAATRVMSLRDGIEEDVEVRSVGHEPHQHDRRRRRDRAEDPQGEHRSRAAARRRWQGWRGGPRRATSSTSTPRWPTSTPPTGAGRGRRRAVSASSSRRWPIWRWTKLAPISAEMARLMAGPAEIDRILARGAERAREIAAPILKQTYDIVGMVG